MRTATLAYDAVALIAALVKTQGAQRFSPQILTNPSGMKRHCAYWIFSGAAAVRHDSELPQDRSFMVEFHDFAFTFVEEGRFVISLAIREEDSTEQKPESYEQWISEFDDLLASAPLDVISE